MMKWIIFICFVFCKTSVYSDDSYISEKYKVPCNEDYIPHNCGYPNITLNNLKTVEDFDRCGPAVLPRAARNYYWAAAGRQNSYRQNFEALARLAINARRFRGVADNTLDTTILGSRISFPVGIAPAAAQGMAHATGEKGLVAAATSMGSIMVLSMLSQTALEDVAETAFSINEDALLWMQVYIFVDREETLAVVRRAENSGFRAIVINIDSPMLSDRSCSSLDVLSPLTFPNLIDGKFSGKKFDRSATYKDFAEIVQSTNLPVVAKGVMTATDAVLAVKAGASAIWVSNNGGRQLDSGRGSIEALPGIVRVLGERYPNVEVYVDGGIRNGWDVFKAVALGARAAFIGRPSCWGLGLAGPEGVEKVLSILKKEYNEAMVVGGFHNTADIRRGGLQGNALSIDQCRV